MSKKMGNFKIHEHMHLHRIKSLFKQLSLEITLEARRYTLAHVCK